MTGLHPLPELAVEVRRLLPADLPVHLVGGAVRDWLLQRPVVDMDFVLPHGALHWARHVARHLQADVFPLDPERDVARVILQTAQGRQVLDFAAYRGPTLEDDLRLRDFTINALAVDPLQPHRLIDPTHGLQDLKDRRLRLCYPQAALDDPVRVLRAVRFALELNLAILPETRKALRLAAARLSLVSPERVRDELFRLLGLRAFPSALRLLRRLNGLAPVLPEAEAMTEVALPPSYGEDRTLWDHTLHTLEHLQDLLDALLPPYDPDKVANVFLAQVSWRLGRYRHRLADYLREEMVGFRPRLGLLKLGVLYHDVGKQQVPVLHPDPEAHARAGRVMMEERARALRLAREEVRWLGRFVGQHMWPRRYQQGALPEPVDLYRFYRTAGEAGVALGLLHLADFRAKAGLKVPRSAWKHQVDVVRRMWEAWWEHRETWIDPVPLLRGHDLMQALGLTPGPLLGRILEALKEAQVAGEVTTREQALDWVRAWLQTQGPDYGKISSSNGS